MADSPIVAAARAARQAGIVVIPPVTGEKRPAADWKRYQTQAPTNEELRAWFLDGNTPDGLGLLCGVISGNLELIEFEDAATAVAAKMAMDEAGLRELRIAIETGYSEATPGGGIHWLVRTEAPPAGNQKLASKPCPEDCPKHVTGRPHVLIETRGEGGYVVVAPSAGGRDEHQAQTPYRLAAGGFESIYRISDEDHETLLELFRSLDQIPRPVVAPPRSQEFVSISGDERPGDRFERLADWGQILVGWKNLGTRSDGLTYWRRPGKKDGQSATTGMRRDQATPADLLYVFSTSTEYDAERGYGKFAAYTQAYHSGDFSRAARELAKDSRYARPTEVVRQAVKDAFSGLIADPETGEIIEEPTTAQRPDQMAEEQDPDAEAAPEGFFWDWTRFWLEDHASEDWLCEPLLPRGRGIATYSKGGQGKSLLALDICARLSLGLPIFGQAYPRVRVVYIDKEMTESDVKERLVEMGYGPETDWSHLFYHQLGDLPPLDTPAGGVTLLNEAVAVEAELVVIDTMSRVLQGEENSADTVLAFYRHTGMPIKRAGMTLWRLDHSGKDADKGTRGTSAKNDDVDLVWQLKVSEEVVTLAAEKRRQGWIPEKVTLRREADPLRHEIVEGSQAAWPAGTRDLAERLEHLGVDSTWSRRRVQALLKDEGVKTRTVVLGAAMRWLRRSEQGLAGIMYEMTE